MTEYVWQNNPEGNTPITAEQLNRIEGLIANLRRITPSSLTLATDGMQITRVNSAYNRSFKRNLNHGLGGNSRVSLSFPGEFTRLTINDVSVTGNDQQRCDFRGSATVPIPGARYRFGVLLRTNCPSGVRFSYQWTVGSGSAPSRVYLPTIPASDEFSFVEIDVPEVPSNVTGVVVWASLPQSDLKAIGQWFDIGGSTNCGQPWFDEFSPAQGTTTFGLLPDGSGAYEKKQTSEPKTLGQITREEDGSTWIIPDSLAPSEGGGGGELPTTLPISRSTRMRKLRQEVAPNPCKGDSLSNLAAIGGSLSLQSGCVRLTTNNSTVDADAQAIRFDGLEVVGGSLLTFGCEVRTTGTAKVTISTLFERGGSSTYRRYGASVAPGSAWTYIEVTQVVPAGTTKIVPLVGLQKGTSKVSGNTIEVRNVTTCGLPRFDSATQNDPAKGLYYSAANGIVTEATPDPQGDLPERLLPLPNAVKNSAGGYDIPADLARVSVAAANLLPSVTEPYPATLDVSYVGSAYRPCWMCPTTGRFYSWRDTKLAWTLDGLSWTVIRDFGTRITAVRTVGTELLVALSPMGGVASQIPEIWCSSGYGNGAGTPTWTKVLDGDGGGYFDYRWGFWVEGQLVFVSVYGNKSESLPIKRAYASLDGGVTWRVIFAHPSNDANLAHIHAIGYDKYWDRVWITTGDGGPNRGIYYSDDWRNTNPSWRNASAGLANICGVFPVEDGIIFGSDDPPNGWSRYDKVGDKDYSPKPHPRIVRKINNVNNLTHVVGTMYQRSPDQPIISSAHASVTPSPPGELCATVDGGKRWHRLWVDPLGTTSINGGGLFGAWGPSPVNNLIIGDLVDSRQVGQDPAKPNTLLIAQAPEWL
jgi:hypothetical protein